MAPEALNRRGHDKQTLMAKRITMIETSPRLRVPRLYSHILYKSPILIIRLELLHQSHTSLTKFTHTNGGQIFRKCETHVGKLISCRR